MTQQTVSVVEDDPATRDAWALCLEGRGYRVHTAGDGREALDHLRRHPPPDLILLDLWLPGMSGWEFRQRQRHDPALAPIPVVVLSAVADAAERADALGDVGYLQKP